ncbi:MAG: hypothetical protein JO097_02700 [Acidobacteriaceae bacterium]|nr:hypothetical protein [Acidobacteriaceae bacterium]MBV9766349.1 hypothetical protein [Acidobacteriaceae bacterium]
MPKEFRFKGSRVRVKRQGDGVLLQPVTFDVGKFFAAIDACGATDFMSEGREQPAMPVEEKTFD